MRSLTRWLLPGTFVGLLLSAALMGGGDGFKVTMLPDTQHYTDSPANIGWFFVQAQWIVDHRLSQDIAFVTHVGDIVQHGAQGPANNQVEWERALAVMDVLDGDLATQPDGLVPYSAVIGNHDYDAVGDKSSNVAYVTHFGPARYGGRSWFVGSGPGDANMAQVFSADGEEYLHLGLEWRADDDALEWAMGVLAAHPDLPTIVSTHEHLRTGNPGERSSGGATPNSSGDNSARSVFRKLVEPHEQVFLVLCGHYHGNGRRESTTALGGIVHEVLADYQTDPNGGNGWMQVLTLRPELQELRFDTFSPGYVPGVTPGPNRAVDPESNFTVTADVAGLRAHLARTTTLRLRQGQDAGQGVYVGTQDTYIGDGALGQTLPNVSYGDAHEVRADLDADHEQGLLRFDGLVGTGPGQVPPGTLVDRAILTLTTEGDFAESGNGATLHRMIVAWDESSTWNSLVNGIDLASDALPQVEVSTAGAVAQKGTRSFDVTGSVQAWVDGEPNLGWAILASGSDRWAFRSSEWGGLVERPMLTVRFDEPCPAPRSYCVVAPNSAGQGASISFSGTNSVQRDDLVLRVGGCPPNQFGLFFYGAGRDQLPLGDGFLCVSAPLYRLLPALSTGASGAAQRALDLASPPASSGAGQITAGSTWDFQFWFRDPSAGGAGSNTSNGLEVFFCP